jgi:hypothetical protein
MDIKMNNHVCKDCHKEAKVACMCIGEVKKFCYDHFIPHFEDKKVFHKIMDINDLEKIDPDEEEKRLKLEKIIARMNRHQSDIENHNKELLTLRDAFLRAVNEVFGNEEFTYMNVLKEIKDKKVIFSNLQYSKTDEVDTIIENFKRHKLFGVLDTFEEIKPLNRWKFFERLKIALEVAEDPIKAQLRNKLEELTQKSSEQIAKLESQIVEANNKLQAAVDRPNDLEVMVNRIFAIVKQQPEYQDCTFEQESYLDESTTKINETVEEFGYDYENLPHKISELYDSLDLSQGKVKSLESQVENLSKSLDEIKARAKVHDMIEYSLPHIISTRSASDLFTALHIEKYIKANFPNIKTMDLSGMDIGEKGSKTLFNASFPSLENLILFDNRIGSKGAEYLAKTQLLSLVHLDLGLNEIEVDGMQALSKCKFPRLEILNLEGNDITPKGMALLYKIRFNKLISLNLRSNFLDYESIKNLLTDPRFSDLAYLNLDYNYIKYYDIENFIRKRLTGLQDLHVMYCNLKEHKSDEILTSDFGFLTYLDLSWRFIQVTGMEILSRCDFKFLTHLNLKYNNIQTEGVRLLAFCNLPRLKYLDISWNNIKKEGVDHLLSCKLPNLVHLLLASNNIRAGGVEALVRNRFPKHLITLDLSGNIV